LASRLGAGVIDAILDGQRNVMIGIRNDKVIYVPFTDAIRSDKEINKQLIKVLDQLSI
jgi:6-phosphofructokinase 1